MKKSAFILYDVLIGITVILLLALPISKAGFLTDINIRSYSINHDLNEQTDRWINTILSPDYILESSDYKIEDAGFIISLVCENTQYEKIKQISISVSFENDYKNSAIIYKYIGDIND